MIEAIERGPTAIELAPAVLRDRYRMLPPEERSDLCELLPVILRPDGEERESALQAANELLNPSASDIRRLSADTETPDLLELWLRFVGRRIRELRTSAGLTQAELAEKSGLPQSHISRLENGQHSPSSKTLEKFATALGTSSEVFELPRTV